MVSLSRAHYHKRKGQARAPASARPGRFPQGDSTRGSPLARLPGNAAAQRHLRNLFSRMLLAVYCPPAGTTTRHHDRRSDVGAPLRATTLERAGGGAAGEDGACPLARTTLGHHDGRHVEQRTSRERRPRHGRSQLTG